MEEKIKANGRIINPPKYIAGMKAGRYKSGEYYSDPSCYGLMYLVVRCRCRCDLRKFCKTKSKINKRNDEKNERRKR